MKNMFKIAVTGQSLIKHDIRGVDKPGFQAVREVLSRADLSFTNFESTVLGAHGGWPLKGRFFGCSQPVVLDALRDLGFQALSLSRTTMPSTWVRPASSRRWRKSTSAASFTPA